MISLRQLQEMSVDERWNLIDSDAVKQRPLNVKTCKPNYVLALYCNVPMPHWTSKDGCSSIQLDEDNIFNGTMSDVDEIDDVKMTWRGYTCQLYDGGLKMCPVQEDAIISGVCNNVEFKFCGARLEYGVHPGFLELFESQ